MALSAAGLRDALRVKLLATGQCADGDELTDFCAALAEAVVEHITASAVVVPTLLIAPPMGGPVTGTGQVT